MKAKEVIAKARIILQDEGMDYWPEGELAGWLNDGRMEAYALRPDLYQVTEEMQLVEGYAQVLPAGSRRLFRVERNISHPRQREITVINTGDLAKHRSGWRSMGKSAEILHYMYDELQPSEFQVYPPARGSVVVEINYAKLPESIPNDESELDLVQEGEFASALIDFVLYRAFQKEADTTPAFMDRATAHHNKFTSAFRGSVATQAATSPNQVG
jgi:hypothetical protein